MSATALQAEYLVDDRKHLLRTLLYFDIFDYPLTAEEIKMFSFAPADGIDQTLEHLVLERKIFRFGDFYSTQNNSALEERRKKGNELANKKLITAKRFSRFVSAFPFVRAVLLSGSISKNYMTHESDIDYFIITEANRLWLVRTALAMFRRVFLFNSHKNFCTNYFIDINNLSIPDRNLFTAIEFVTLMPMFDTEVIERLRQANRWTRDVLPNAKTPFKKVSGKRFILTSWVEKLFPFKFTESLNAWLMNQTLSHWKRRYRAELSEADFEVAFRSTIGISKSHPQFFQKKVLDRFQSKIKEFENRHDMALSV